MRRRPLPAALLAALLALPLLLPLSARGAAAAPDPAKLDAAFARELAAAAGSGYYDVVVVFRSADQVARLDSFGRPVKRFRVLPMGRVLLSRDEIAAVTAWPEVRFVAPNRPLRILNDDGRRMTRAEEVQTQLGFTGRGVHVAVVDTGADGLHPDLDDNLRHNWEVIGTFGGPAGYVSSTPDGIDVQTQVVDAHARLGVPVNTDEYGHGTHVIGTIAGTGEASDGLYRGMAPGAGVESYSTSAGIFLVFVLEAYDHIIARVRDGLADIRIVSNSWGSEGCAFDPFEPVNVATRIAFEHGILSVFAYGNSGPAPGTCNPYATAPYVLGIGATDKAYKLTGFSSRGRPDGNHDRDLALRNLAEYLAAGDEERRAWDFAARPIGLFRPSVVAPGQDVVSAQNPAHPMTLSGTSYGAASGTSMATPHVSGIAALILEAYAARHPGSRLTPLDLIRLIEVTADKDVMRGYDTHEVGAGFVDARAAVERALAGDIPAAVTLQDLVRYEPPATVRVERAEIAGSVLVDSWETDIGYQVHDIPVADGALRVRAEVTWASDLEKVYLSLYRPGSDVARDQPAVTSAGLLDITNRRLIESYPYPEPGTWKLRVDGRLNLVTTQYRGYWEVHYPDNAPPTAAVEASPDRIAGSGTIDIAAEVRDPDGVADLAAVTLVVLDGKGKVRGSWSTQHFQAVDATTLRLRVTGFALAGPAPWKVELTARDSRGHLAVAQDLVGRK